MKSFLIFLLFVATASGQGLVHGGASGKAGIIGAGYTYRRLTVGAEWHQASQPASRSAVVAFRGWRGLHVEGGAGTMRTKDSGEWQELIGVPLVNPWCPRKCEPLGVMDEIVTHTYTDVRWRAFASAGAYYQTPGRVFVRVGYRRLFVRNDHDTNQVYTSVGITF